MSNMKDKNRFWQTKSLSEMTHQEWELVCDGCAKCCLSKLQDEETEQVVYTDVACDLLSGEDCRCRNYKKRSELVKDCVALTPENIVEYAKFMPDSCAYRLLVEGKSLPDWHHLVSGNPALVHELGQSVRGRIRYRADVKEGDLESYVVDWC